METSFSPSRRKFIRNLSLGIGAMGLTPGIASLAAHAAQSKKMGVALVGLGYYAG